MLQIGDPVDLAPGFDDHAFISQYLDGDETAFSSGDIGRLYWGKVNSLTRNILFIKPRTLLMLDVAVPPKEQDADVTLLCHTKELRDIVAGDRISKITKQGYSLNIVHLSPDTVQVRAVETPHYLKTLLDERPLIKEGMLTVTARTAGQPLVLANLLTTTADGIGPDVKTKKGDGYVSGVAFGRRFVFSSRPGSVYSTGGMETDALAMADTDSSVFVAMATVFRRIAGIDIGSGVPMSFELKGRTLRYYRNVGGEIRIRSTAGRKVKVFHVGEGNGVISIQ